MKNVKTDSCIANPPKCPQREGLATLVPAEKRPVFYLFSSMEWGDILCILGITSYQVGGLHGSPAL